VEGLERRTKEIYWPSGQRGWRILVSLSTSYYWIRRFMQICTLKGATIIDIAVGGMAQWFGRRSLAGGLSLIYA